MGFNLEELSYTNPNAYSIYHRGAASRQAEIDELKWMLKNSNAQADDFCKKSIELQKRIDEALKEIDFKGDVETAIKILKGKENEN